MDVRYLRDKLAGHGRPVSFVLGIFPVTAGGALGVECDCKKVGGFVFDDFEQHIGKTEYGVRGQPGGSGQTPDGIIGPINIGIAVYDIEFIFFQICCHVGKV